MQPFRVSSPLRQRREGQGEVLGVGMRMVGGPQALLDSLVDSGFRGVGEVAMRRLVAQEGLDVTPPPKGSGIDMVATMVVELVAKFRPATTEDDILKKMLAARFSDEDYAEVPDFDEDYIRDTVLEADTKLFTSEVVHAKAKIAKKQVELSTFVEGIKNAFASYKVKAGRPPAKAGTRGKKPTSAAAATKAMERIYADIEADADKLLKSSAPPEAHIWTDTKHGRWKLPFLGDEGLRRSVSWTHVGSKAAACACLRQLWDWSHASVGKAPPAHVEALLAENGF